MYCVCNKIFPAAYLTKSYYSTVNYYSTVDYYPTVDYYSTVDICSPKDVYQGLTYGSAEAICPVQRPSLQQLTSSIHGFNQGCWVVEQLAAGCCLKVKWNRHKSCWMSWHWHASQVSPRDFEKKCIFCGGDPLWCPSNQSGSLQCRPLVVS